MNLTKDLDPVASEAGKDLGMDNATLGAPPGWQDEAMALIRKLAGSRPYLCADDLWAAGLPPPPEPRALGPVFVRAASVGVIASTLHFVRTIQTTRHRAPVRVWRSKLCVIDQPFDEGKLLSRQPPAVQA
jgi:hypothetical protein